jgi:pimeloyl-ACP methyl ester carboxylesterase
MAEELREPREGYAEVGDQRLHYVEAGDGPLIMLLHGFPEFWYGWRHQIGPLAAAGFRVEVPSPRCWSVTTGADPSPGPPRCSTPRSLSGLPSSMRLTRGSCRRDCTTPARGFRGDQLLPEFGPTATEAHRGALRPSQARTLVIWGEDDRYLGPELAKPDHDDVPNLDRVERLPDASHWVHHDEAERVTQLLTDFFALAARPLLDG